MSNVVVHFSATRLQVSNQMGAGIGAGDASLLKGSAILNACFDYDKQGANTIARKPFGRLHRFLSSIS